MANAELGTLEWITFNLNYLIRISTVRGRKRHVCVSVPKECKVYRTEGVYCRYIQYIRILVFVQSRRVHLFIVNCLLKNEFNKSVIYNLHI